MWLPLRSEDKTIGQGCRYQQDLNFSGRALRLLMERCSIVLAAISASLLNIL